MQTLLAVIGSCTAQAMAVSTYHGLGIVSCNASDPYQRWSGATLEQKVLTGKDRNKEQVSPIENEATRECINSTVGNPATLGSCSSSFAPWLYNASNATTFFSRSLSGCLVRKGPKP